MQTIHIGKIPKYSPAITPASSALTGLSATEDLSRKTGKDLEPSLSE